MENPIDMVMMFATQDERAEIEKGSYTRVADHSRVFYKMCTANGSINETQKSKFATEPECKHVYVQMENGTDTLVGHKKDSSGVPFTYFVKERYVPSTLDSVMRYFGIQTSTANVATYGDAGFTERRPLTLNYKFL
jgi:hypothetical protein